MGASFRNVGQIEALAGCDNLTVSPELLEILSSDDGLLERKLFPDAASSTDTPNKIDEKEFRWQLNEDPMATEKLAEGISNFAVHQRKLEELMQQMTSK